MIPGIIPGDGYLNRFDDDDEIMRMLFEEASYEPSSLEVAFDYDVEQMERRMRYKHMDVRGKVEV